jgi:hypothetical protein
MPKEPFPDVPAEISELDTWPLWRRLFRLPSDRIKGRIEAWGKVSAALRLHSDEPLGPPLPGVRGQGIFGASRVHWQNLLSFETRGGQLTGSRFSEMRGIERISLTNPEGALINTTTFADFRCDITDVEGIAASQSQELHFDDVDSFGRYFNELEQASIDHAGLDRMLDHREVRIIRDQGHDSFSIVLWDPRLFLSNAGGSHHFAGAAYIARAIAAPLSLSGPLHIHHFNVPAWRWLLDRYHVVHARARAGTTPRLSIARILDEFYSIKLPLNGTSTELLLLPREARAVGPLLNLLASLSMASVSEHLEWLLRSQSEGVKAFEDKWPVLYTRLEGSVRVRMEGSPSLVRNHPVPFVSD